MANDGTDKVIAQPDLKTGLSPEHAANISAENQVGNVGLGSRPRTDSWTLNGTLDGLPVPRLELIFNDDQINDCGKDKCIVKGKRYTDSKDIPGNHPKPLLHADGKPVLGPDGQPIEGPDRVDLEKIAADARKNKNLLSVPQALLNFRHSGDWDFQRVKTDDGRPIFTQKYQNFANVAIGYILGSLGMSFDEMSKYANTYCEYKCHYNEPMSKQYPFLADRQVKDFQIGIDLYRERHPNERK